MKKKLCLLLALLMLAALLTGCGSTASYDSKAAAPAAVMAPMAPMAPADGGMGNSYDYAAKAEFYALDSSTDFAPTEAPAPNPDAGQSIPSLPVGVKLIYRADISLESTAFDTAVNTIQSLAVSCGGYFENSNLDNYSNYRYAYYTIRIPAEQYANFCDTVAKMGESGEAFQVNNISRSAEDVSEFYYDTDARLTTQKTKLARLQELLSKAENMEDIITLESAISETEFAIEDLTGTLRKYDSLVGYSTVHVNISEVYKLSEVEEPAIGFGAKLAAAFKSGCSRFVNNCERFLLSLARAWVGWLIFLVIAAVAIVVIVRLVRRSKAQREVREARRMERLQRSAERYAMPKNRAAAEQSDEKQDE